MALTYIGTGGLFTDLGVVIAQLNLIEDELLDWEQRQADIQAIYEASGQQVAEASLIQSVDSIKTQLASMRDQFSAICDARLQDYDTVIAELHIPTNDIQSILTALIKAMRADSATINANVVTLGSVTAGSGNVGNGTILVTKILDGVSSPISGAAAQVDYKGQDSQFSVDDTLTFTCVSDSYSDSNAEGEESFSVNGTLGLSQKWALGTEGAGIGPTFTTVNAGRILDNGDFEVFSTTNLPDSWDLTSGVVTTNLAQTLVAGEFYRGLSAVKLIGNGVVAAITITQDIAVNDIDPLRAYCCTLRYKASATDAGKTFTVILTGTGYVAGSTETYTIAGASFPTSWTLASFFVNIPANPPSDLKLSISFSGTPTASRVIYVDDVCFDPVTYFNGIGAVSVAGATPFVKNDLFTVTTDNTNDAVFSNYFRRNYGTALPGSLTSAETISDGLAQP